MALIHHTKMPPLRDFSRVSTSSLFTTYKKLIRFGDNHHQEFQLAAELRSRPRDEKDGPYEKAQQAYQDALARNNYDNIPLLRTIEEKFYQVL